MTDMPQLLESEVFKLVNKFARARGWRAHKWERRGRRGANDFFYTKFKKRIKFIEYKMEGKEPNEEQKREIAKLRMEGHEVHVVDTPEEGYDVFQAT